MCKKKEGQSMYSGLLRCTPRDRLELSTFRLTAERSAIELTGIIHQTKGTLPPQQDQLYSKDAYLSRHLLAFWRSATHFPYAQLLRRSQRYSRNMTNTENNKKSLCSEASVRSIVDYRRKEVSGTIYNSGIENVVPLEAAIRS